MNTHTDINASYQSTNSRTVNQPVLVAYIFLDAEGNVLDCDQHASFIFNTDLSALRGMNLPENISEDDFRLSFKESISGKTVYHNKQISLRGKQANKNYATYLRPIYSQGGSLHGVACFVHYPNQGSVSPFEFLQQAEYFNLIANNSRDVISLHSTNGKVLFLSPSFKQVTGIPNEEVLQDSSKWPVIPEDRYILNKILEDMTTDPQPKTFEYRFVKSDGSIHWAESRFQIIKSGNLPASIAGITREITDRKEIEKALQISETKYRNLIRNLPTGIVLIDLNGRIAEANDAFFSIIGRKPEDLGSLLTIKEIDKVYKCDSEARFVTCLKEKRLVDGQQEYVCDDGTVKHILYSLVPLPDEAGNITAVMANVRDLTAQIKVEDEIRQQYDFLNMVINSLQQPFFVKDENHRWIMLNEACISMMGYSREEVIGKSDYDIYPKEQADVFWEKDDLVFREGSNINEEKITWSTGEVRTIVTSKYLYTDKLTGKNYIVGSIHDITRLKEIQEILRESEQKYHDLFQNANDLIFITDLEGNFTDANHRVIESLGIPLEKLLNLSVFDLVKNIRRAEFKEILARLIEHKSVSAIELETTAADGSTMILEVHGRLMYNNNDEPVGIQGIARDISEKIKYNQQLNQYNEELKELNKSKDKMFSIIAHDLKDPFNSLLGFSEILLEEYDTLETGEIRDYIKIINNTAKHSLNLLENLLTWSRLLTGRLPFTPMKLLLAAEVESAITIVSSLAYRKRISIDNLVPIDLAVSADQNMLLSILHNFIMNAIKFTNPGGKIEIEARESEQITAGGLQEVIISITDNGIGMTEAEIGKLFQVKALYSTAGTQNEKGTGLGLLLTREMIERHGGSVNVKSKPGEGTSFSFTMPLAKE